MAEIDSLKSDLQEIQTAKNDIKTALENEGETVGNDIRTYAVSIPNVNKVKTVNSIEADTNKNIQIDASKINVEDTAETKQSIKTFIETLRSDVDNISVPEYSVIETTVTEGYSKTYSLTKDGTEVGVKINIPKDLVVNKGSVKVVATAGTPYEGAVVGDKYLDIELNDPTKDHIYIPVKELVDVYTAGDGIEIGTDNVIKSKNSNLVNGTANGSIRAVTSMQENEDYTMQIGSVAFGNGTKASGANSFAIGYRTEASNYETFAIGNSTKAKAKFSSAEGQGTIAYEASQHVQGTFNVDTSPGNHYLHIVGNGTDDTNRSNAHTIDQQGNGWFAGNIKVGGTGQDDTNAKQLATQEYVDNNKFSMKTITNKITTDQAAGFTYSFGYKCDDLMVFLNGEKLVGKESDTQTTADYSYSKGIVDTKCTSITFTNDFTIVTGDIIELVLINPEEDTTAVP